MTALNTERPKKKATALKALDAASQEVLQLRAENASLREKLSVAEQRLSTPFERGTQPLMETLENLADTIPHAIWRANPDGTADYFSKRFYDYVGYKPEEFLGWAWLQVIHSDHRERVLIEWQKSRDLGVPFSVDFRVRLADGSDQWFLSLAHPFYDESGEITKYYGTWTNIEKQKNDEREHEQALRVRDEFLSIASHELKTPLTSLRIHTHLLAHNMQLEREELPKEKIAKYIIQVDKQAERLIRLVDDMLDISRIQTGRLTVKKENLDACAVLHDVIDRMRDRFTSAGCGAPQLPTCEPINAHWDRMRIEQVLNNLLTNALKYGKGMPVSVGIKNLGETVRISVKDNGLGIAPENQEKVFNRFERFVSANEVSGLGLGLYISKQIIEAHQGKIWVESEPGNGSTFYIELPIK